MWKVRKTRTERNTPELKAGLADLILTTKFGTISWAFDPSVVTCTWQTMCE